MEKPGLSTVVLMRQACVRRRLSSL